MSDAITGKEKAVGIKPTALCGGEWGIRTLGPVRDYLISSQARYDHFDNSPYLTVLVLAKSLDKPLDKISVCKTDAQKPLYQAVFEGGTQK